ncbi:2OG-Fe(II) oxygenase [Shewanella rhizosphaerae]|uniref:2OG-Fe(II) oxygenase n=1 Tax=Shewanella rhizosphaerae TaxID=2864207 RepID=UPI001C65E4BF|nr:2OG-Fe(II) oxygenase [Shewanella rhizosphaerae]QYK14754.1 2OG-Fe(II) oxygenase [Shewanella rhizosphaerae]
MTAHLDLTSDTTSDSELKDILFADICDRLATHGNVVLHNVLAQPMLQQLLDGITGIAEEDFKAAAIGRQQDQQVVESIRRDKICWLNESVEFAKAYFDWSEELRLAVNRYLYLGLFDQEAMLAYYAPGAFYKRHLDAFRGQTNRKLTSILYLNPDWQASHGGELLMYEGDETTPFQTVEPRFGTMVIFLSELFPHEVSLSHHDRYSLTSWYRINDGMPGH